MGIEETQQKQSLMRRSMDAAQGVVECRAPWMFVAGHQAIVPDECAVQESTGETRRLPC